MISYMHTQHEAEDERFEALQDEIGIRTKTRMLEYYLWFREYAHESGNSGACADVEEQIRTLKRQLLMLSI